MVEGTILGWLLIGLVAGVVGRLLLPGRDPGGIIVTIVIGIAGALLAGFLVEAVGIPMTGVWPSYGAVTLGAFALLLICRLVAARRG